MRILLEIVDGVLCLVLLGIALGALIGLPLLSAMLTAQLMWWVAHSPLAIASILAGTFLFAIVQAVLGRSRWG